MVFENIFRKLKLLHHYYIAKNFRKLSNNYRIKKIISNSTESETKIYRFLHYYYAYFLKV